MKAVNTLFLSLFVVMMFFFAGCGGGGDDSPPPPSTVSLSGFVGSNAGVSASAASGNGLQDVQVSAGGKSTSSDPNGHFELTGLSVPADKRIVVTYEHANYATYQRAVSVEGGKSYDVSGSLTPYTASSSADSSVDSNVTGSDAGGKAVDLTIKGGSLKDANGNAVTGDVSVKVAIGDPSTASGQQTFPGDYMAAPAAGEAPTTVLESVAFAEITINDANGNEITQVDAANPAVIKLRLPDMFQAGGSAAGTYSASSSTQPDEGAIPWGYVEWWSYDENAGSWVREDADPTTPGVIDNARIVDDGGVLFGEGKVTHFTWWNCDRPVNTHACITVKVVDDAGAVLSGTEVVAQGVDYNGSSYPARTAADGTASVTVKQNSTVKIIARQGQVEFAYPGNDYAVGSQQGSTINGMSGTCYDLTGTPIVIAFNGTVSGTVTHEGTGLAASGYTVYASTGTSTTTGADGAYSLKVPEGQPVTIFVPGLAGQTVTASPSVTADFVIPNRAPVISSVTLDPASGSVEPGGTVTLSFSASDPEGHNMTYLWSTDAGSLSSSTGTSTVWTAPSTTAGSATVTLTVTDSNGASSQATKVLVWQDTTSVNTLKVTVRDNNIDGNLVAGVVVILYQADNVTIQQTLQTDASGVADFGDIGRSTATFAIAHSYLANQTQHYFIETIRSVSVGDIAWYLELEDSCDTPVNVTVTPTVSGSNDMIQVFPGWGHGFSSGTPIPVQICPNNVQTDNLVSFLAVANSYSNGYELAYYNYLLDQAVTEGANYDINLNRAPVDFSWTSNRQADFVEMAGYRKGVEYGPFYFDVMPAANFGTFKIPYDLPAEKYDLRAIENYDTGTAGQTGFNMQTIWLNTLGTSQVFSLPDYVFSGYAYNDTTGTYSWNVNSASDFAFVECSTYSYGSSPAVSFSWEVVMDGAATSYSVQVPQLPTTPVDVASWYTLYGGANCGEVNVEVGDLDNVSSFQEAWNMLKSGTDPEANANYEKIGGLSISSMETPMKALVQPASAGTAPAPAKKNKAFTRFKRR